MDEISTILAKEKPSENDLVFLRGVGNDTIDGRYKDYGGELKALGKPPPITVDICKTFVIMFNGSYNSWSDFLKLISNPLNFEHKLKNVNLSIPIEDHILDQLFPIIFLQGLDFQKAKNYGGSLETLFLWMKAFLALQILIKGLKI